MNFLLRKMCLIDGIFNLVQMSGNLLAEISILVS